MTSLDTQSEISEAERRDGEDRRFTDKPDLDPAAVRSLPLTHPAILGKRTLFPTTVVEVTQSAPDRILVSGKNNRKLGERVTKGALKNYAIYSLSLEERATCPDDCDALLFCYGNGMQMARRHRIGDPAIFYRRIEAELEELMALHHDGVLVRLHVLGDFPDPAYVNFWFRMLLKFPKLACYGYTHRRPGNLGDPTGKAIAATKGRFPDQFRIRYSSDKPVADGAVVIARIPEGKRVKEGLVCPAQTDATACCATCGFCWEGHAKNDTIVFIKHGPKSLEAVAAAANLATGIEPPPSPLPTAKPIPVAAAPAPKAVPAPARPIAAAKPVPAPVKATAPASDAHVNGKQAVVATAVPAGPSRTDLRRVQPLTIPQKREQIVGGIPAFRVVKPTDIYVEVAYQRDLSARSIRLIRKIVTKWNWSKFKVPICVDTPDGFILCIDGQHTAIGAASHPEIGQIPIMVVDAASIERRADAFVSHNRDRLVMTPAQIFYGDVAAQKIDAKGLLNIIMRSGATVPKLPVQRNYAKAGEITAIADLRKAYPSLGAEKTERLVRIASLSKVAPISLAVVRGLQIILTEKRFEKVSEYPDAKIAKSLGSIDNLLAVAQHYAAETGQSRFRAAALLIAKGMGEETIDAAS